MKKRLIGVSQQALFALNVLIAFLLLFEKYVDIPIWLRVFGRMHPMFLHFPIVILLLAIVLDFVLPQNRDRTFSKLLVDALFLLGALTASITVVMGLFLSHEELASGPILWGHKWMGVAVAGFAYLIVHIRNIEPSKPAVMKGLYLAMASCIVVGGHLGSELTHGEDFLWGPVNDDKELVPVALEDAIVFDDVIKPVLQSKCLNCHSEAKSKGNLIMLDSTFMEKGGKNGKVFERGDADGSLLIQRINLPEQQKKHMPPKGKPQLTSEERQLLYFWINSGAPFTRLVIELDAQDSLKLLAERRFEPSAVDPAEVFRFAAARNEDIESLRTDYRVIYPTSIGSPALCVNFYNSATFTRASLRELQKIGMQIVSLDLSKMSVLDEDLKTIASFENLRRLNLNFTDITESGLANLAEMESLVSLSLSGTKVNAENLLSLKGLNNLKHLYLWNTKIRPDDRPFLQKSLAGIDLEFGFVDDGLALKLNKPRIDNKETVFKDTISVALSHPVKETSIRYTINGDDPDSMSSLVYDRPIVLRDVISVVRSRGYKEGWKGSDPVTRYFLKSTYTPDSVEMATLPAKDYLLNGPGILTDGRTNNADFRSGNWLGYRETDAEVILYFRNPVMARSVTLSLLTNTPSYIFPPEVVELWGESPGGSFERLGTWHPHQPESDGPVRIQPSKYTFEPKVLKRLKIICRPLKQLPPWHSAKGERGWVFMDEILVN